jgi:hypothetical protein
MEDWGVLIPEHHEGYISWEDFRRVQKMLSDNGASFRNERRRGAAKKGPALLAGLLRCRRCGRKLMVAYSGREATVPRYTCYRGRLDHMEKSCISVGGSPVDAALAKEVLRVIEPCAIDAAALAVTQQGRRHDDIVEALTLELEAARYAAELARRRYDVVDPTNRLVAAELERRWNEALSKEQELEARIRNERPPRQPSAPDVDALGHLQDDLGRVWDDPGTDVRIKKRIVRALVEEIVVDVDADAGEVVLVVHWKGGAHTELRTVRRRRGYSGAHTSPDVVDAIRQLAFVCGDKAIAGHLNRNGILTARGNRWTTMAITSLRNKRGIDVHTVERQQAGGWMTLTQAAEHLGVSPKTARRVAEDGLVVAAHPLRTGPWVFKRADLDDPEFRRRLAERPGLNPNPAGPPNNQIDLMSSTTYRGEAL